MWEIQPVKNGMNMLQKLVNILWDVTIQSNKENTARKPDIVVLNKNEWFAIIDIAVSGDITVSEKVKRKFDRYIYMSHLLLTSFLHFLKRRFSSFQTMKLSYILGKVYSEPWHI